MKSKRLHRKYIQSRATGGQTLAEYALVLAFISVVAIVSLISMGSSTSAVYSTVTAQLSASQLGGQTAATRH